MEVEGVEHEARRVARDDVDVQLDLAPTRQPDALAAAELRAEQRLGEARRELGAGGDRADGDRVRPHASSQPQSAPGR